MVAVNADRPDVRGFDLVHVFNCRVEHSFQQQMASCQAAGVPVVVSPIWVSLARSIWGSRGALAVLTQSLERQEAEIEPLLQQLQKRELVVQLPNGTVHAAGHGDGWPVDRLRLRDLLRQADGLLPNSWLELQALRNDLQWDGDCFEIAHSA